LHIVMTTHSPTTVALASDSSVYILQNNPRKLEQCTQQQALNLLTDGVPRLALSIDGRRQVLVESPYDQTICTKLFDFVSKRFPHERSLEFISPGRTNPKNGTHENTGVEIAILVHQTLVASGNNTVFALIDSDRCENKVDPQKRVFIFSCGNRDGLENLLYDPLLLICFVLTYAIDDRETFRLPSSLTLNSLKKMDAAELENTIEDFISYLLGHAADNQERVAVGYGYRFSLQVRNDILRMDDHDYEDLLRLKIPQLERQFNSRQPKAKLDFIDFIFKNEELIPNDLYETFMSILDAESHLG
jgi:hypothetical protein